MGEHAQKMPRNELIIMQSRSNLPVILEPLSPLANFSLGIEQEVRLWRIRFGSQCINRGKSVCPQAISLFSPWCPPARRV
jgi:hypothetical protein